MDKITVVIEKSTDGGYGIYVPGADGLFGYGLTEEEAKAALQDAIDSQVEYFRENGTDVPAMLKDMELEYKYDFSAFFQSFPFINVSEFARTIGINPSLMRRYKDRLAFASEKQKAIIQTKFSEIVNKMSAVQF